MSSTSEQIVILYKMQNTPQQIADMLELDLDSVLLLLQSQNLLSENNIRKFQECSDKKKRKSSSTSSTEVNGQKEEESPEDFLLENKQEIKAKTAKEIYEEFQARTAKRICELAVSPITEDTPASVILKAGIYVNEEASGRNEARAKKANNSNLLDMAQLMHHLTLAKQQVNRALGVPDDLKTIPVECERVC